MKFLGPATNLFRSATLAATALMLASCSTEKVDSTAAAAPDSTMIRTSGEVASRESAVLGPPTIENIWNYTIAYMAPEGTQAREGMPVLRFETQDLQTQIIDKRAELDSKSSELARVKLTNTEALKDLDLEIDRLKSELEKARQKSALPESVLAKKDYREHQLRFRLAEESYQRTQAKRSLQVSSLATDREILEGEVAKLEREVSDLETSIAKMNVTAPRNGMVVHLKRWGREKLSVGDQVWMGMRVMELPDLDQLVLQLEVAERDLNRVAEGQKVRFTVDASPDVQFTGEIESLGRIVRTKSRNQPAMVIDAVVSIDEPDPELMRPGMRVSAEVMLRSEA